MCFNCQEGEPKLVLIPRMYGVKAFCPHELTRLLQSHMGELAEHGLQGNLIFHGIVCIHTTQWQG